jgi:hypothetical protein
MLRENHSDRLKVFVVWEPILPTDRFRPSRLVHRRVREPRVTQFWDKNHLVAKELRAHLAASQVDCCGHQRILWDVVAVFPKDAKWDSAPDFIGEPVVRATPEAAKRLAKISSEAR